MSNADNNEDKFRVMCQELNCAIYRAPAAVDKMTTFSPARIFVKQGGVYVLKACNAAQPSSGVKADPEMDPWVALLRTTYSEKQANDILEYLLLKYNEVRVGGAPCQLWDRPVRTVSTNGCEMKPLSKLRLLRELYRQ